MNKHLIKRYAKLIARCGANIQKGQYVCIDICIDQGEFAKCLVEECYRAGAKKVEINWSFQPITKINYKYQSTETLSKIEDWEIAKLENNVKIKPCRIIIISEDPNGLNGIDKNKMYNVKKAIYPIKKPFIDKLENNQQWVIAAIPSFDWAKMVFPGVNKFVAVDKLWEAIFNCCRVYMDTNPIDEWEQHNINFMKRSYWLSCKKFDYLKYYSKNGTDFKVWLIPESHWCGGIEYTKQGVPFNPNIPTEEIFTTPMKGKADGKLVSTKPLSYQGQIIEDFYIVFKDGKAVEWNAKKGNDLLTHILTLDEGASYIGEVAIVPKSSPISKSNILFYETLFDENASCHVAVGCGFCDTIDDYQSKTLEECQKLGVNDSMSHVDFMVGSDDLSIIGVKDGIEYQILKDGEWAFDPEI